MKVVGVVKVKMNLKGCLIMVGVLMFLVGFVFVIKGRGLMRKFFVSLVVFGL